jgi:hypothetical protein
MTWTGSDVKDGTKIPFDILRAIRAVLALKTRRLTHHELLHHPVGDFISDKVHRPTFVTTL